jgi:diacylglycerol kinase family enzyme
VLFYNPKSGGGKAERFHLAEEARRRGIEPIELRLGEDLETLVRGAVQRGADALAMAGGDGSQAIVAKVAAELDLPYACIPAGTRNHFALDLGVDRDDVVGALDAFVHGGERRVDLAEVNGQVFVNNVSLGLYAEAVQRPGYREAKLHTLLETVPDALGPDADVPQLSWQGRSGGQSAAAVLVSNNPYRLGRLLGSGTRPRLSGGVLGIAVLLPLRTGSDSATRRRLSMEQWTAKEFLVESEGEVPAGIDGEAVTLSAPLRFRMRPEALRVRIAPHHPGASPSALEQDTALQTVEALAEIALRGAPAERSRAG